MTKKYIRKGYCNRCGDCCSINNFPSHYYATMSLDKDGYCLSFDRDTRLCTIYENRPHRCRISPRSPEETSCQPNCTYTFMEVIE